MKTIFKTLLLSTLCATLLCACGGSEVNKEDKPEKLPINLTVVLDLSDRLERELVPTQAARDTAIVDYLVDQFIKAATADKQLTKSRDCMRVMFYPQPSLDDIAVLAKNLDVNLDKADKAEKKKILLSMKQKFNKGMEQIYNSALESKKWVGCDIWGFFSNKDVDKYCIKNGYRNIVVLLTDGYLFHVDNKIKEGNNYSYLTQQTLSVKNSELIIKRNGLDDLEVLMLEVNPYDPKTSQQMHDTLQKWFEGMGVQKLDIANTAMPKYTETIIDNFLNI